MTSLDQLTLPEELRYTSEHVWIKNEGETCLVGITDYAQDQLGEVAFVDMPANGAHFAAGDEFGSVESVKSVNALFMPVAGLIVEVNTALEEAPTLVNASCYADGWLVRIKADNAADLEALTDAGTYKNLL